METKIVNDSNYPLVTVGMPVYNVELYIKKKFIVHIRPELSKY